MARVTRSTLTQAANESAILDMEDEDMDDEAKDKDAGGRGKKVKARRRLLLRFARGLFALAVKKRVGLAWCFNYFCGFFLLPFVAAPRAG